MLHTRIKQQQHLLHFLANPLSVCCEIQFVLVVFRVGLPEYAYLRVAVASRQFC